MDSLSLHLTLSCHIISKELQIEEKMLKKWEPFKISWLNYILKKVNFTHYLISNLSKNEHNLYLKWPLGTLKL